MQLGLLDLLVESGLLMKAVNHLRAIASPSNQKTSEDRKTWNNRFAPVHSLRIVTIYFRSWESSIEIFLVKT
jgi:hypothetical protein